MVKQIALSIALFFTVLSTEVSAQQWRPVGGNQANISGMALVEHDKKRSVFLIVHDNKKKDQERIALLTINGSDAPVITKLKWPGDDLPDDLEAATTIPGIKDEFIVFSSHGTAYHIKLNRTANTVALIKTFDIPVKPEGSDFEGFALQTVGTSLIAVWADRGTTTQPATLAWSKFDLARYAFDSVRTAQITVPYPVADVRHISDLKVDQSGAVFITSASDPGDEGPFSSAMYLAGSINRAVDGSLAFSRSPVFTRLFVFDYQKVEAFEFIPGPDGGITFGTDNEKLGSSILLNY